MTRFLLTLLIFIHGSIHLIGAIPALRKKNYLTLQDPTNTDRFFWKITLLLFFIAASLILAKRDWWFIGITAIVLSQILIIQHWHEARFGTIANVMILLSVITNFACWQFRNTAAQEVKNFFQEPAPEPSIISKAQTDQLPEPVKKWIIHSGAANQKTSVFVRLRQKGTLRTSRKSKWLEMNAEQYFRTDQPGFVWTTHMDYALTHISGKDDFLNGKGHMLIKLASLITVADATGRETDQGTMLRYLAEIQWFPSMALSPYISWVPVSSSSAIAIMTYKGLSVKGTFLFTPEGDIASFEAKRYMENNGRYSMETWYVPVTEYKVFGGIRVPAKGTAIWKLKDGDFNWFNWEITEIDYNMATMYD